MRKAYVALFIAAIVSSVAVLAILSSQPIGINSIIPTPTPSSAIPFTTPTNTPTLQPTATPSPSATPSNAATDTSQEQLSIFNVQFVPQNVIVAYLVNSGEYDVAIAKVFVDDNAKTGTLIYSIGSPTIKANTQATLSFNHNWQRGQSYAIRLETANGKGITYVATVP